MTPYRVLAARLEVRQGIGISIAGKPLEAFQVARLPDLRGPRAEIVLLDTGSQFRGAAKKTASFSRREASKPRRLQIGRGAVGCFDDCDKLRRQYHRQSETDMDCSQQASLDCLVGVADYGLEWRDHVSDHVFRSVVQQHGQPTFAVQAGALVSDNFDQQRMLRYRIDVRALGLAVPARHAREPMRDIFNLDIQWRRIKQVESSSRQHALPCASGCAIRVPASAGHRAPASLAQTVWRWQLTK